MEDPDGQWVEERLREFEKALDKYLHLLRGGRIDREKTMLVERIELEIIQELEEELSPDGTPQPLDRLLDRLEECGWLHAKILEVAERIGEDQVNPTKALESFLVGDVEAPGAKAAFIVVQAVARYLASKTPARDMVSSRCPVCGAESKTMTVEGDGYYMVCPFCGYAWRVSKDRVVCPFCGSDNPVSIGVYMDRKRRIGLFVCQECGSTWRGILDRSIRAPRILLPLISLGAEAFRAFLREDMVNRGGQG